MDVHRGLGTTMGPLLAGTIVSGILWGVSLVQTFHYYTHYMKDHCYTKMLVGVVFVTETVHLGLITQLMYAYLIKHFDDPDALNRIERNLVVQVLFEAMTAFLVQSFFLSRIWRLGGRRLLVVIPVGVLITAEFGVSVAYSVEAFSFTYFHELEKVQVLAHLMNASAAATDVGIAASLCVILHYSKSGFQRSNLLVNKLMAFTINTGLLTSTCAVVSLISDLADPQSFVYICFFFLIGHLYANSLLATLNARKRFREKLEAPMSDFSLSRLREMPPGPVALKFAAAATTATGDLNAQDLDLEAGEGQGRSVVDSLMAGGACSPDIVRTRTGTSRERPDSSNGARKSVECDASSRDEMHLRDLRAGLPPAVTTD